MHFDVHRVLVISASATAAAGAEQLIVSVARRLRYGPGAITSAADSASWRHRWAHLILSEALATVQAEIVHRQLRASIAVDRALAEKQHAVVGVPRQRDSGLPSARRPGTSRSGRRSTATGRPAALVEDGAP